jgi:hypothetical protein
MTAPALAAAVWLIMNRRQHSRGSLSSNIFNVGGIDPVVYVAFGMAAYGICYLVIKRRES